MTDSKAKQLGSVLCLSTVKCVYDVRTSRNLTKKYSVTKTLKCHLAQFNAHNPRLH